MVRIHSDFNSVFQFLRFPLSKYESTLATIFTGTFAVIMGIIFLSDNICLLKISLNNVIYSIVNVCIQVLPVL